MTEENNIEAKTAEAQAVIEAEKKKRSEVCGKELQELMAKHKCMLDAAVILRQGKAPDVVINIVPQ